MADWLNRVGGLLQKYAGGQQEQNPQDAHRDFDEVSRSAPKQDLASGLAEAFRSDQTPPFGQMIGQIFGQASGQDRVSILQHLAELAPGLLSGKRDISPQEAERVDPREVEAAATQAERQDTSIVDRASEFYAAHPTLVKGLGGAALAFVMSRMMEKRGGAGGV